MKRLPLALPTALAVAALLLAGCTAYRVDRARSLAAASEAFSIAPSGADARLLIAGDSTAVGTGASSPRTSLAGRLSAVMPRLAIVNVGVDGAKFQDVIGQLAAAPPGPYTAVLVMAGGNDVIRLTSQTDLHRNVNAVADRAAALAPLVIFLPAGNVGNAPFFLPPVSWWMTARAKTLHEIVRDASARTGASHVNLFQPKAEDPFAQEPQRFHAADGLHPSDEGYAFWLEALLARSPLPTISKLVAPPATQRGARAATVDHPHGWS